MTKTMTGYVDLDDGKLYYEMAGDGDTLVLGHAGFVDSRMWDAQWDAFTQKYRVIRFDMRGYGKSDPAHGPRNSVMTSFNSWATSTLNAQLCLGVRLAEPSCSILCLNTPRWFQH